MAMVANHGESVYNIIPPKVFEQERPPMHKSKHSGVLPATASTFHNQGTTHPGASNLNGDMQGKPVQDQSGRTMGKAVGASKNDPNSFMKRGEKTEKVATLAEVKKTQPHLLKPTAVAPRQKPAVPRHDDPAPATGLVSSKNFIVSNAVETILAQPKKAASGTKDFLNKEDYGKTPKYLTHIKNDIDNEFQYIKALQEQQLELTRSRVQPMEEAERLQLIEGLKARWESVNHDYQSITHLTTLDTVGKIKKKEKYEAELSQIEKDIERLNKKNIVVDRAC